MIIKLKDLHGYYPNNDAYVKEKIFIENQCHKLGLKYNRFPYNTKTHPRQNGMSTDYIALFKHSLQNNIFPFIYMEDDSCLMSQIPEEIYIPDEATAVFWAGSTYESGGLKAPVKLAEYDQQYYRVYNMLAPSVMIIPNATTAEICIDIATRSLAKGEYTDLTMAIESSQYIFLTPKDGLYFYQNNYNEHVTRFFWKDHLDKYLYSWQ
jgi:hypothetical protein